MSAPPHSATSLTPRRFSQSEAYRYFIARRLADPTSWAGARPEILSTDGHAIRRLCSQPRQLVYQHLSVPDRAQRMVERIAGSVRGGSGFLGYAMFRDHDAVAIMNTGTPARPGWMARPHEASWDELEFTTEDAPRMRLLGGARLSWSRRALTLHAALEQRGAAFAASPHAFDLLAHLTSWELRMLIHSGRSARPVEILLDHEDACTRAQTTAPDRIETTFSLDTTTYRDARRVRASFWFILRFDRDLMCVPDDWAEAWIEIQPAEPPGLLL